MRGTLDPVNQRTEDFLVRELAVLRRNHIRVTESGVGGQRDPMAPDEGVLEALVAVGAVTDDEARVWRNRFRKATEATSEALDTAAHDRAHAYVARLLAVLPRDRTTGLKASREFRDVLNALRQIGVFNDSEMKEWFHQFDTHLGRSQAPAEAETERVCTLRELRRVIVGPPQRRGGLRVIGFEVYDEAVVLRWHLVRLAADAEGHVLRLPDEMEDEDSARRAREPSFTLYDDCGTMYRLRSRREASAGSPFGPRVWSGNVTFTPTVPPPARSLCAETESFQFEVVL
jgi:hypothetical protein